MITRIDEGKIVLKDGSSVLERKKMLYGEGMIGYDPYEDDKGITQLGELVVRKHNKIPVGGILSMLVNTFNATSGLTISSLNELMGIGRTGTLRQNTPSTVCLFNLGLGGCGAAYTDEKEVLDQDNIVPSMIPFRIVDSKSELDEPDKYWFAKQMENGKTAYYLKSFEGIPTIKTLWKDASEEGEDGTEVVGNPKESDRTEGMESFAQMILRISRKDLREYFSIYEDSRYPRFNSLGLCLGQKGVLDDGREEYLNVYQFSILNFSNEMLHFDKDLTIIYRLYLS